VITARRGTPAP